MKAKLPAARDVALAALNSIEKEQAYSGLVLQAEAKKHSLPPREEALVWRLVYGVTTYRLSLDYILNQFCRREVSSLSLTLRNILRLACYQIVYLDRIPDFAAVNEAVNAARKTAGKAMAGFVNGVLRNVIRNREVLFKNLDLDSAEGISLFYSHPRWLVERWVKTWGPEYTARLCAANNEPAPLTIRVNTMKISREDYLAAAAEKGLQPIRGKYHPHALVFPLETPFSLLPGYHKGWFTVQGQASMLPAALLDLEQGQQVLDMCSAPGGKATQIAAAIAPGLVTAWDLHESRVRLVRAHAVRLGLHNLKVVQADATQMGGSGKFPRILLDAPCSGLGVLRKKPEIKWTRSQKDIQSLAALQLRMLQVGCELLESGGILIYSTCTLTDEENQGVIRSILEQRQDMKLVALDHPGLESKGGVITTFPHLHGLDGFFIAKLKKVV